MGKLVSVIVPNYCHAKYLDQRIQSILAQTYQEFELIILDDHSMDEGASREVIEKYRGNKHLSEIVYNEENSGSPFKQWGKGISLAKGELIWIAESDDFCEPWLLERLVKEFDRDDQLTLAYSLSQTVDSSGEIIPLARFTPLGVLRYPGDKYVKRYLTTSNHCCNASACLFKKEAYFHTDGLFLTYRAGGDMLFWIEIARQGNVAIVCERINYFRQHNNKVTGKSVRQGVNLMEYRKTVDYLQENFKLSRFRKWIIFEYAAYLIRTTEFENTGFKKEVESYWGTDIMRSAFGRVFIRLFTVLQRRVSLYL